VYRLPRTPHDGGRGEDQTSGPAAVPNVGYRGAEPNTAADSQIIYSHHSVGSTGNECDFLYSCSLQ